MSRTLVFIDSRVADYQSLVAGLGADAEWVLIYAHSDGIDQMRSALTDYSGLDSIQIVSHGSAGSVLLGTTVLDADSLGGYEAQLRAIGASLNDTGDLLLYGCNVAQGAAGALFIGKLAQATGADVAASTDLTGLGGNWVLEAATGAIQAAVLAPVGFAGTLDVITGTSAADTLLGSDRADTINGLGGNDSVDGQSGSDSIDGGDGDDTLVGGFGSDTLLGGLGNDTLTGGLGADRLTGGTGSDTFRFVTTGDGSDTIYDFASGTDKIYVVAANFGLTAGSGANLVINGTPSSGAAAFVYNSTTGTLGFDEDGNGIAAATQLATLSNKPVGFNSADFVLGA
jgi:Ca2+-binding RTX toxin-like protein